MKCLENGCEDEAELLSSFCGKHRPQAELRDTMGYVRYDDHDAGKPPGTSYPVEGNGGSNDEKKG